MMAWPIRLGPMAMLVAWVALPLYHGQVRSGDPDLDWTGGVSDVPVAELSGEWRFVADASDPMVETWRGGGVVYRISQQLDRIVLEFRPDNGQPNLQHYRWDGSVNRIERGSAEIRERARWTDGGRTLEIEGRWWLIDEIDRVTHYTFRYRLESANTLAFTQTNEHGTTLWRFTKTR